MNGPNRSLQMVCDHCADYPRHELPAGYRWRPFHDGDDQTWTMLQRAAEPFIDITDELFEQQYGAHRDALPQRMWFIETADSPADTVPVASISAWWEHEPPTAQDRGRIHWVVVHPTHQGRGLSKAMMTRAMDFIALHHNGALLGTSSGRPWAVKVYLDFGFRPSPAQLGDIETQQGWRDVQKILAHPALKTWGA